MSPLNRPSVSVKRLKVNSARGAHLCPHEGVQSDPKRHHFSPQGPLLQTELVDRLQKGLATVLSPLSAGPQPPSVESELSLLCRGQGRFQATTVRMPGCIHTGAWRLPVDGLTLDGIDTTRRPWCSPPRGVLATLRSSSPDREPLGFVALCALCRAQSAVA